MFGFLKKLFGPGTDFKALMEQGAIIVDVRTTGEYKSGHIKNALNIPVDTIGSKAKELKQNGIEAYNGGSWVSLSNRLN